MNPCTSKRVSGVLAIGEPWDKNRIILGWWDVFIGMHRLCFKPVDGIGRTFNNFPAYAFDEPTESLQKRVEGYLKKYLDFKTV